MIVKGQEDLEPWQFRRHYDEAIQRNYRDYKLIRITPRSEENLDYLKDLFHSQSPYELDFWQPPTHIGGLVDVTVAPQDAEIFVRDLDNHQLDYLVAINDLEQAIKSERSQDASIDYMQDPSEFRLDKYNTWSSIEEHLYKLRDENPDLVTLIEIGRTHENRSVLVVKVGGQRALTPEKVSIWVDAGIHAREWIAPATALIALDKLVNEYKRDPEIQNFLDNIDWYILPVMNPDGYDYTHSKNRMWRKNRRPAQCKKNYFHTICCSGVDLNRNFDWFFGSSGSSSDPCHETYHGPSAFSEPESRAVKEFLEKNPVKAFITLHSYSQLWLIPYGHRKRSYPQDYSTALRPLALRATKALNKLYGTKYAVGTGADLMYEASGASHDYAKGTLHIPYAYLIELRPKSTMFANGFLLPEKEIRPTGEETWEALKIIADEMIGQFVQPKIRPSTEKPIATTETQATETPYPYTEPTAPTTPKRLAVKTTRRTEERVVEPSSTTASPSSSTILPAPQKVVKCKDYGSYCKWWKIHNLCDKERVQQLCALSCLPECQI
ncbi:hypothetical protein FO519_001488 [Halicephalobus sp. NKZ332]|nr:hypothetical protein FO519_001488 [Halicephalobus sp. NKZ332]